MRRKALTILMILTLIFSMTTLSVMATEKTQDGVLVNQTTDKSAYESEDNITTTLKVTNQNDVAISNVQLTNKTPKGYHIVSGETKQRTFVSVGAGESVTLATTFAPDKASDGPATGDSGNGILMYSIICLACVAAIALILRSKKARKSMLMLLIFCLVAGTGAMTFDGNVFAATSQPSSMDITTTVTVDGVKLPVDSTVSFEKESEPEPVPPVEDYTVTFDLNGATGTAPTAQKVENEGKVKEPNDPTFADHTFAGWYKTKDVTTGMLSDPWDFANDTVTTDMTLYAQWERNVASILGTNTDFPEDQNAWVNSSNDNTKMFKDPYNGLNVAYDGEKESLRYGANETFVLAGNNYVGAFDGYGVLTCHMTSGKFTSADYDGTGTYYEHLSGTYAPAPVTYTVTFDMQGYGTQINPITDVTTDSKISAPTAPTADGFIFKGWYKEATCTNEWNFNTDTVTDNITLYAKWVEGETFEEILPDNFPTSQNTDCIEAPENAWQTTDGNKCFISTFESSGLVFLSKNGGSEGYNLSNLKAEKTGDGFVYATGGTAITFKMESNVLVSITYAGDEKYNGTYAPAVPE